MEIAGTDDLKEVTVNTRPKVSRDWAAAGTGTESVGRTSMYIRIGEKERLSSTWFVPHPAGIARVKAKSAKFPPANSGGIPSMTIARRSEL